MGFIQFEGIMRERNGAHCQPGTGTRAGYARAGVGVLLRGRLRAALRRASCNDSFNVSVMLRRRSNPRKTMAGLAPFSRANLPSP